MKKIFLFIFALFLVGFIACSIYFFSKMSSRSSLAPHGMQHIQVRLDWLHQAQFTGMYVAKEKGFYQQEGLDVDLRSYQDGLDQGQELIDGKTTYSIYTPIELLYDISKGRALKAVAAIYQISPYAFASLKSSQILSPQDFKGEILGNKGGNREAPITYLTLAKSVGLSAKDYTVKTLDYSMDEAGDLQAHRADIVDLYRTDQVYFFNQKGIAYNLLLPEDYGFKTYGDIIVTTQKHINKDPDQVRRFVRATQAGWAYTLTHTQEALGITKKYEDKSYADPKHEAFILSESARLIQPSENQPIGTMSVIPWTNALNAMNAVNILSTPVNVNDAYTTDFLTDNK